MIKAVTEGVAAFFCAVTVYLDKRPCAHILLIVDTVGNTASELGHIWLFLSCFLAFF